MKLAEQIFQHIVENGATCGCDNCRMIPGDSLAAVTAWMENNGIDPNAEASADLFE